MNCESLMRERLPGRVYQLLRAIGDAGDGMGYGVFAVGGFVRDLLIGRQNLDVDVVVEGDGIALAQSLADTGNYRATCHERFGTATLTFPDGFKVDLATARTEVYSHPGALPSVSPGSAKDDLRRRDFTINAMAIELNEGRFGDLVDFFGGKSDLESGSVRVLHDLSFVDDPTRIFRAIRFERRYEFSLEPHTKELLERSVAQDSLRTITGQRLRNEIMLILKEEDPVPVIRRMEHFKLMGYIHPRVSVSDDLLKLFHRIKEVLAWSANKVRTKADVILINLMTLLDQLDLADVNDVCERLVLRRKYVEALITSKDCPEILLRIENAKGSSSKIYKILKGLPLEVLLFAMAKANGARDSITLYLTELQRVRPLLNGNDLHKLGYAEGPLYAEILDKTFAAQLDGLVTSKRQAVQFIKSRFPLPST